MNSRLILPFLFLALVSITGIATRAALPGDAVDDLKKNATERLRVEVTKVERLQTKRSAKGYVKLLYTAKVFKVDQSKTGVKVGSTITIDAYHWTVPFDGPANPPMLKPGWKGGIYLNAVNGEKKIFKLAAYGNSFY